MGVGAGGAELDCRNLLKSAAASSATAKEGKSDESEKGIMPFASTLCATALLLPVNGEGTERRSLHGMYYKEVSRHSRVSPAEAARGI